jgi:glucuronosyltransferase
MKKVVFLISLAVINPTFGANILFVFGGGNLSHKTGIWPLVVALADRGHKITFVSSIRKEPQRHPNVTDLVPIQLEEMSNKMYGVDRITARANYEERKLYEMYDAVTLDVCKISLNSPEIQNLLKTESFELVVANGVYGECGLLLAHYFRTKCIISSSTFVIPWYYDTFGLPNEASWIPEMSNYFTYPMDIYERMLNTYYYVIGQGRTSDFVNGMDKLMRETLKIENPPSFAQLEQNASLVFLNSHYSLDFPRSLPPMFIPIGGMSSWEPTQSLPKDIQEYLDGAEDGVVLITFGSTMDLSAMPSNYKTMFFNMMRKFDKIRFIWRWSASELPVDAPPNLKSSKWLPQREILEHPKTKAFLTHCGINGITEATFYGVPLVAMPFFADQDFSAYRIVAQEVGLLLESRGLTQEIMDSTFHEILNNPKYKKNMEIRSKMFKDRPQSPIELAVYWTEFVLRHDDFSSLKPVLRMSQSIMTRNLLDVYLMAALIFLILPLILLYILVKLVKNMFNK